MVLKRQIDASYVDRMDMIYGVATPDHKLVLPEKPNKLHLRVSKVR